MDDASPVTIDFGYGLEESPRGSGGNAGSSNRIGYAISHNQLDQSDTRSLSSRQQTGTSNTHHKHNPSLASIDSVVDHHSSEQSNNLQKSLSNTTRSQSQQEQQDERDSEHPTWSELKTKAGKERKRLPLACIACRRKKIKCSGEKPACKHCLKARIPCVYKVTTRKAAPRTDYMAMLDKRLKRMEDRVIKIIPKEELPDTSQRSSVRPPLPGTTPKSSEKPDAKRAAEDAFEGELNEWSKGRAGVMPLDSAARVKTQRETENKLFTEGAEALPSQQIQEHLAEVFFDCVYGQAYLLLHKPSFMRKLKAGNVPPVLILSVCAISARFSTHPRISTEPAFLRGEQWATPARNIVEQRHFEPNLTILTCMVILGLHYFGTCEGGLSWSFGGQAMRMGYALQLHKELDQDPLGLAQAERAAASGKPAPRTPQLSFTDREIRRRTMWACYLMDSFNSSGTERPSFLNEDYLSIQLPIKESLFQMDVPGQTEDLEGSVPSDASRHSLSDPDRDAKSNMGVAAYVIRAVVIWKRVVKYLNLGGKEKDSHPMWDPLSQFASLQRQISSLKSSLPSTLVYNSENLQRYVTERIANQFIFLHIVMAQNSLFLHRFAIPTAPNTHRPYPPNTPKTFLATGATTVLDAASQISKLISDSTGHTLTAPFAGYCAYTSAIVHVWGIHSKNVMLENTSRENLRHNYKYINRMKRYWGMFHYMAESIKDTYRSFADAAARAEKRQNGKTVKTLIQQTDSVQSGAIAAEQQSRAASPSAMNDLGEGPNQTKSDGTKTKVFQYGDWFNKYPHGVSEQEWEQSHLPHRRDLQKGTEAVMSQQAELQSVEEFFASLSPPSKADEGPNKKKAARKRGKSMAEDKQRGKDGSFGAQARTQSQSDQNQQRKSADAPQRPMDLTSNSLYPLSDQTFPPTFDMSTGDIDVPMTGATTGLQSGQGNSAFDLSSSNDFPGQNFQSIPGLAQRMNQGQSPFDYVSPASSTNTGAHGNSSNAQMNFNFNYTSAVPQLDRQMVFGGYSGMDVSNSNPNAGGTGVDFWNNPFEGQVDVDGFSGFNDPSFGLNTVASNPGSTKSNFGDREGPVRTNSNIQNLQQQRTPTQRSVNNNNTQNQNMASTAWFMPFNIEPPTSTSYGNSDNNGEGGFGDFAAFDSMMGIDGMQDLQEWIPFSPANRDDSQT